jgi:hypothetical protein
VEQRVEGDRRFAGRRADALAGRGRQSVREYSLVAKRGEVSGYRVGDLAAEPLHGRVVEIEGGACGHGGRSMTERPCGVNRGDRRGSAVVAAVTSLPPRVWRRKFSGAAVVSRPSSV